MRILVQPHDFALGGSQLNAVELAGAVRDRGHDVSVACRPGPITDVARTIGLDVLDLPEFGRRPSATIAGQLRRWARERSIDVLHGYEWPPGLETWAASRGGVAAPVTTVYSMEVAPFLPGGLHLVTGTHEIAARAAAAGQGPVHVIEPPVDVESNAPGTGGSEFRASLGIGPDELVITVVGRLAPELKLEGILGAIGAMTSLPVDLPARLVIVGDGTARSTVDRAAADANGRRGRTVVHVVGEMRDPRPAYDAADVALGMGGSALRALAFRKPLVVQGEAGYWRTLTPDTYREFAWSGWYGVADGQDSAAALVAELLPLLRDDVLRANLATFGYRLVREQYSLDVAAARLVDIYEAAVEDPGPHLAATARAATGLVQYKLHRKAARLRGRAAADDFNAVRERPRTTPPPGWSPPQPPRVGTR